MDPDKVYTIAEAARELKVSIRWLTAQCRTGKVEHLHMAGRRRFTVPQIQAVKTANTIGVGQKSKPQRKASQTSRTAAKSTTNGKNAAAKRAES